MGRMSRVLIYVFLVTTLKAQMPFQNVAAKAGKDTIAGDAFSGTGLSFVDFDSNVYDDLVFVNRAGDCMQVYKNQKNGTFVKLPPLVNHTAISRQILSVINDIDSDKHLYELIQK